MNAPKHFEITKTHAVYRPAGEVPLPQAVKMMTSAISFAREQNIRNLLVITSALTGFEAPSLAARYFFVKEWAKASNGTVRIAMVARPEMIDAQKIGGTVAANTGLSGDVFTSEAEALAWLQGGG